MNIYGYENRGLDFLDIKIKNNGKSQYDYNIFRKDAITNIQVKPELCCDLGINVHFQSAVKTFK